MASIYAEDFLKERPAEQAESVALPIHYRDAESMMAFFPLPVRHVKALLPAPGMRPVEVVPGYAVLALIAFEYRDTDIGPYNELGICFPILFKSPLSIPFVPLLLEKNYPRLGFYVHRLPVTTQVACRAGREIWGYPKFVADIGFEENNEQRICHLREGGKHILSLSVDRPEGRLKEEERNLVTYSVLEDRVLKTVVRTRMHIEHRRIRGAELTLGDHSIARELEGLEISKRLIESRIADRMEAVLPAPSPC